MSFNGSGTFSINTAGQPVVTGTTITSTAFNAFTADIATGLSTCMLKDGTQTATAGIGFYAGTVSLPGIYFGTDTATGLYRIGLNNTGYSINGTKLLDLSAAAFAVTGTISATSTISATTSLLTPSTTFNLVNTTATTINFAGAATTLNIGNSGGTNTILGVSNFSQGMNGTLGSGTPAALAATTGTFSDTITSTKNGAGFTQSVSSGQNALVQLTDGTKVFRMWHTTADALQFGTVSAHSWDLTYNGITIGTINSTGLAVTGVVDINGTAASATASHLQLGSTTQSTIGANGAASALTANPLGYLIAYLGSTKIIIPYYNA